MNQKIFEVGCKIRNAIFFHGYGQLGRGTYILKPMRVIGKKNVFIGDYCSVLHHARMEAVTAWETDKLQGEIRIGNRTTIEQNCHIIAADKLVIGDDCVISSDVYISDCGHGLENMGASIMQQPLLVKKTTIGNGCFIGTGAKLMPGVTLGNCVVVGANAVVVKDVPEYVMVAGVPARPIKRYDVAEKRWKRI